MDQTQTPTQAEKRWPLSLERLRLRFRDQAMESGYREDRFRHNVANIRFAFLAGIGLWVAWGLLLRPHMLALADRRIDTLMRFGVFIPMLLVGLGLTFTPLFRRIWQSLSVVIATSTLLLWIYYVSHIQTLPIEYGYVGVILITAFTYTLLRLRFLWVVLITVIGIAAYLPYAFTASYVVPVSRVLATLYLVSFGALGCLAAYRLERFSPAQVLLPRAHRPGLRWREAVFRPPLRLIPVKNALSVAWSDGVAILSSVPAEDISHDVSRRPQVLRRWRQLGPREDAAGAPRSLIARPLTPFPSAARPR
jgi:hypothetical protein